MRNVLILTRREVASYFVSSIAYVAMAMFLLAAGIAFALLFSPGAPARMNLVFELMAFVLLLIIPILTMKSLAEEHRSGTIETLMTAPVTDVQVVLGKYFGCLIVYLVMLLPTLVYAVLLGAFGNPDFGPVASGYLGLVLLGGFYVAVGLLASSMTRNQVVSAVVAFVILAVLVLFGPWVATAVPSPWRAIVHHATVRSHYADFGQGAVDLVHVIYFVALTVYALFFAVKILESRRWR
jgi:ABC-2 type transport system permease protein